MRNRKKIRERRMNVLVVKYDRIIDVSVLFIIEIIDKFKF
jgi:hypothetical protein